MGCFFLIAFIFINVLLKVLCTKYKNQAPRNRPKNKYVNNLYSEYELKKTKTIDDDGYEMPKITTAHSFENMYIEVKDEEADYQEIGAPMSTNVGGLKKI